MTTTNKEETAIRLRREWMRILDRTFIHRNTTRAADRIRCEDFRSACANAKRIMERLDALRATKGLALPPPEHLPPPLRGFGPFKGYYAAWCAREADE